MTRRVTPGTPFSQSPLRSASTVNRILDAADAHAASRPQGPSAPARASQLHLAVIKVRNASGGALDFGAALEISSSEFTEQNRQHPWFVGSTRAGNGTTAILLAPTDAAGSTSVDAAVDGEVLAIVSVSDANHTHAYHKDGEAFLRSGFGGPHKITWKPSGTGTAECWVVLNSPLLRREAKADTTIAPGDTAKDVVVWFDGSAQGTVQADYDWGDAGCETFSSGAELFIDWIDDVQKWRIEPKSTGDQPFYIRNEHTNLTAGRGLELGQVYSGTTIKANLRSDCSRAYCVLAEDINVNTIGRAKVSGWVKARVDIKKLGHTHCFLRKDAVVFESGFGGPLELLQTPTSTGEQDILVRWQPLYRRRIRINASTPVNDFGDCNFYVGSTLGTIAGTDDVYFNWMTAGMTDAPYGVDGWANWDDSISVWIFDSFACSA